MYSHGKIDDSSFLKAGLKFILEFKLICCSPKAIQLNIISCRPHT